MHEALSLAFEIIILTASEVIVSNHSLSLVEGFQSSLEGQLHGSALYGNDGRQRRCLTVKDANDRAVSIFGCLVGARLGRINSVFWGPWASMGVIDNADDAWALRLKVPFGGTASYVCWRWSYIGQTSPRTRERKGYLLHPAFKPGFTKNTHRPST